MDCLGTDCRARRFHSALDGGSSSSSSSSSNSNSSSSSSDVHHEQHHHYQTHKSWETCGDSTLAAACDETLDEEELETFAICTVPIPCSSSSSRYSYRATTTMITSNHQPSRSAYYQKIGLALPPEVTLHNMKHYGRRHFLKLREAEVHNAPDPTYEHRQIELRPDMRAQLLDWLMEVSANFFVRRRTFQAAVNYCDRFLSTVAVVFPKEKLQLLAITSLFVSSKMEEVYPAKAQELAEATAGAFTACDIVTFEIELMTSLAWNLTPPTSDDWAEWYLLAFLERGIPVAASAFQRQQHQQREQQQQQQRQQQQQQQSQQQQHLLLFQRLPTGVALRLQLLLDLALLDVTSLHFYPSMLAAAGLYLLLPHSFHPALAFATGYQPGDRALKHCKAYLTFLSTGLFDALPPLHDQQHQHQSFWTTVVSPRAQAAQVLVPMWDRHSLQNHPANLLPHLLGRITAISGHGDDINLCKNSDCNIKSGDDGSSSSSSSSSNSSMFVAAAVAANASAAAAVAAAVLVPSSPPSTTLPPPSFLGYRSVFSGNSLMKEKEDEDEEGMDFSVDGEDEEEEGTEGEEEEEGEEEDTEANEGEVNEEDFFGHSLELHDDWGYTTKKNICERVGKQGRREGEDYSCDHVLRLEELGGDGSENELGWSMATTMDPQTTRDSIVSFFPSEEKEKGEDRVEVDGWMEREERRLENEKEEEEDEDNDMRGKPWNNGTSSPCLASFFFPHDVVSSS